MNLKIQIITSLVLNIVDVGNPAYDVSYAR